MNTKIINLYGGPGTGKSTSAAYIYYLLKDMDYNAELVREYAKDLVWAEHKITQWSQPQIMGEQLMRESALYGKVDYVITDSPLMLSIYYARHFSPAAVASGVEQMVLGLYEQAMGQGHQHIHVLLGRSKKYNPAGRYQTEEQAREIDVALQDMLIDLDIPYIGCGTTRKDLEALVEFIRHECGGA